MASRLYGRLLRTFADPSVVLPKRFLVLVTVFVSLTLIYFGAGKLGLTMAFVNASASAVWPATGIALAAFLLLGYGIWPAILLGAFLVNETTSDSVLVSLAIAMGNTLEGLVGAYLVNRFANGCRVFARARDIFQYVILACLFSTMVSATGGVTSLMLGGLAAWDDYGLIWLTWWLGDVVGAIVVTPVLVLWAMNPRVCWNRRRALEAMLLLLLLLALGLTVFGGLFFVGINYYPLEFVMLPIIVWSAFRFGQRETATATLVLSGIAIWGTLSGFSPFARASQNESLLLLQAFMGCIAITGLGLAAVVAERRQVEEALRRSCQECQLQVEKRTAALSHMVNSLQHEIAERRRVEEALQKSEEKYRSLYTNTPVMMHSIDRNGRLLSVSNFWLASLGYEREEVIGQTSVKFLTAASQRYAQEVVLPEYFKVGICKDVPYQFVKKNGTVMDVLLSAIAERGADGNVERSLAVLIDITQRKQAEEALHRAHEELEIRVQERTAELLAANEALQSEIGRRTALESHLFEEKERAQVTLAAIGDAVITTDTEGQIESLNALAEQLTGWHASEARGLSLPQVFEIFHASTREPVQNPVQRCLREKRTVRLKSHIILRRRDGQELTIDDSAAPIRNREGKFIGAVLTFRDVTEQRKLMEHISYQATHDNLTGLINRHEFERRLNLMLDHAKENRRQHALCYFDLDQFKVVNDTCGHTAGDEMLRQLTALLKTRVRERDSLARLGGDEFGLLLGECSLNQALRIANVLKEAIQDFRFVWQDKLFTLSVSIGLVPITGDSGDAASLLSAADSACYAAKEKGRNRVNVYQPGNSELVKRHGEMQWISRLHQALAEGRFCLYYQPIVPIGQEVVEQHGEILLRLLDEEGVLVPPGAFIPPAERYQQMLAVDCWVIRTVFAMLRTRLSNQLFASYAINLSGQSLSDEAFLDFVIEQLEQTGISSGQICFEITETAAITNLTSAIRFISALRNRGCRFALDDFGSGLCSFAYLKNLPVDYLKIDGSFVKDIAKDPIDYAMVEAINRIGHLMGIKTIAESMEDPAILEKLKIIGVDYAQGYGIAKPRPIDELETYWKVMKSAL